MNCFCKLLPIKASVSPLSLTRDSPTRQNHFKDNDMNTYFHSGGGGGGACSVILNENSEHSYLL